MRLLIADDHDLLRDTLVSFIAGAGGIETETAADLDSTLARIATDGPFDLVLLDYGMPGMHGLDGLRRAMAAHPGQRVALMSGTAAREVAEEALSLGAAGFLPKTMPATRLVNAIRFMALGEQFVPVEFLATPQPAAHPLAARLTARERQMLQGLCAGKSNKEIARDLGLSEPTIKLHLKTLYRKLDAQNRTQAALIAREEGLF